MKPYNWILIALGILLVCDGFGSIVYYWNSEGPDGKRQGLKDHAVRILRTLAGVAAIALGVLIP